MGSTPDEFGETFTFAFRCGIVKRVADARENLPVMAGSGGVGVPSQRLFQWVSL